MPENLGTPVKVGSRGKSFELRDSDCGNRIFKKPNLSFARRTSPVILKLGKESATHVRLFHRWKRPPIQGGLFAAFKNDGGRSVREGKDRLFEGLYSTF